MTGEVVREFFPESYDHLARADDALSRSFSQEPKSGQYGDNDREGRINGDLYQKADMEEFEAAFVGQLALLNSLLGQGHRAYADLTSSQLNRMDESLGRRFIQDNTVSGDRRKKAFRRDIYPSELPEMMAHAAKNDIPVHYPSTFEDRASYIIGKVEENPDYQVLKKGEQPLGEYLQNELDSFSSDLEKIGNEVLMPEEGEIEENIVEAALQEDRKAAVISQSPNVLRQSQSTDAIFQTPEVALQYLQWQNVDTSNRREKDLNSKMPDSVKNTDNL